MTTIPRPQPLPGGGWRRPNSGTKSLEIRPKQLFLGYFSYANPPPIPHLAAHTGVESHLSYGTAPNANGWQVDWVEASVWLRRGADDHGTWIAKKEFFLAVRSSDDPRRQLQGQRMLIDLLKHEQGHFDITALLMRDQFNDVVALINEPTIFKSEDELHAALDVLGGARQVLEDTLQGNPYAGPEAVGLYDKETKHGTDMMQQEQWNAILRYAWKGTPLREILKIMKKA
jgi:hypothetical protein